jgi:ATP-dependent helicase/nuclease subunit B
MQTRDITKLDFTNLILTPNSRLARWLKDRLVKQTLVDAKTVITTPNVQPFLISLQNFYQIALFKVPNAPLLITGNQESFVWQRILDSYRHEMPLLQPLQTAKGMQQAYQTLIQWNINLAELPLDGSEDFRFFKTVALEFEEYCQLHNVIISAQLANFVRVFFEAYPQHIPPQISLYEFTEQNPQQQIFFKTLKNLGCSLHDQQNKDHCKEMHHFTCDTLEEEILTMALWAKARYQLHPEQQTICVVPNLSMLRNKLLQVFTEVLTPRLQFDPSKEQCIFNISGGYLLSDAPVIHHLLLMLKQNSHAISYDALSIILRSSFIAATPEENYLRHELDRSLRQLNLPEISWQLIQNTITDLYPDREINFSTQLAAFLKLRHQSAKQTLPAWQNIFSQLAQAIGWPGDRVLNSEEYQQINRWFELLQEFSSLDLENNLYDYDAAYQLLYGLTKNTLFASQSYNGPIQILGLLEAVGISADAIWLMHLDDKTFPAPMNPSPFLPSNLQQKYDMPHASAKRQLHYAQQILASFKQHSRVLIFSHHASEGDQHLNASPLLDDVPKINIANLTLAPYVSYEKLIYQQQKIEPLIDSIEVPFLPTEIIRGGSSIIKNQALCPFKAFAIHRLHAQGLLTPDIGLNYQERGNLLHQAMEKIWKTVKTQENLLALETLNLEALVFKCVQHALYQFSQRSPEKLRHTYYTLEASRLKKLCLAWLEFEKQRPSFEVIACEQNQTITLGSLTLKLKLDRVDCIAPDTYFVVDYKTGNVTFADWLSERPNEPQLLLYALTQPSVAAIAFAQIKTGTMKFIGLAEKNFAIPNLKLLTEVKDEALPTQWNQLLQTWHKILTTLAEDFVHGKTSVDPKDGDTTCRNCDLQALCRIHLQANLEDDLTC